MSDAAFAGSSPWHDEILVEEHPTIIECLEKRAKLFVIDRTEKGYRIVELCDGYYGTTLSQDQFERFIAELQLLAKAG
ncbi:hypothetical protein FHP25_14680 [Vineibacter terrae]|uniref:Uncharacterized protein n=1 Tax=Vineibacter terrae TaxID=2586908 RepID=A0A5C8PMF8_9HYPH|nr:hypothetical protein [Vineibacter terrae]TXL75128.1 hypothetical protein FHP25_14680 [Vineibacter terrae]